MWLWFRFCWAIWIQIHSDSLRLTQHCLEQRWVSTFAVIAFFSIKNVHTKIEIANSSFTGQLFLMNKCWDLLKIVLISMRIRKTFRNLSDEGRGERSFASILYHIILEFLSCVIFCRVLACCTCLREHVIYNVESLAILSVFHSQEGK